MTLAIRHVSAAAALTLSLIIGATACTERPEADPSGEAPTNQADSARSGSSTRMAPSVVATMLGCDRDGDSLRTIGSIRNQGQEDVRYVDVSLTWADSTGALVATDVASIVGGETIMAGDSIVFDVATAHPQASQCVGTSIFFYEPIP
jgi:hypothetical protein